MNFAFLKTQKHIITIVVALFFTFTSLVKIFSFSEFILNVQNYDVLPLTVVLPFSILIVLTELIAGIGLILNIQKKLFGILLIVLISIFTGAIIFNLLRGNTVDCGCFGDIFSDEISWWSVIRNLILGLTLFWLISKSNKSVIY